MPIRGDALKVKKSMQEKYGDRWEEVFYATANKQGRSPETWEKIEESLAVEDVLLGRLATTVLTEGAETSMIVQSSCRRIISEAIAHLTVEQQEEFAVASIILEEFYSHMKAQVKAALALQKEPGIQKWGARKFSDWKQKSAQKQASEILQSVGKDAMAKAREAIDSAIGSSQKVADKGGRSEYDVDDRKMVNDHITRIFRDAILNQSELL